MLKDLKFEQDRRIVHLFHSASVSGPEKLVLPALARFSTQQLKVHFLIETRLGEHAWDTYRYARSLGIESDFSMVKSRLDRECIRNLAYSLESTSPELMHCHDVKSSLYGLLACRSLKNAPFLCSTHHGVRGRPDATSRLYEQIYRYGIMRGFDHIYAVSEADLKVLRSSFLPPNRVFLHRNGAGTIFLDPKRRDLFRAELNDNYKVNNGETLLGFVGRLSPEKNPFRLLRILAELKASNNIERPWKCFIFGDGPLRSQLEASIKLKGLESHVVCKGFDPNIGEQIAGLDILVNTSQAEGLPITMLEAGAAGTPVFAPRTGGIPELIPNTEFGLLYDPDMSDAVVAQNLASFIEGEQKRVLAGERLRQRVELEFSQNAWIKRLFELYALAGISRTPKTGGAVSVSTEHSAL